MTVRATRGAVGAVVLAAVVLAAGQVPAGTGAGPFVLDRAAERWVDATIARMTVDQKIGQMIVPSFESTFTSSDSALYDELAGLIHDQHVGGFHVFGGSQPAPDVLLNSTYPRVTLGHPLDAASLANRLQAIAPIPLLNTADFEAGVGFRMSGGTPFPRLMAFGAAGDERLVHEAARITAVEARAVGVHVNFAPVSDVNNNARNPVINTRAFGEAPATVGALVAAYVRGARDGGLVATLKHFPGHGDTDVDSHLGLPLIAHPRDRLDRIELPPFRAGIEAGAGAVMTAHIALPALEPAPGTPATFSPSIVGGLLRQELSFRGLVYTDSMTMLGVSKIAGPGEAAVRAVQAGHDLVLHSPDVPAAFAGLRDAVARGEIAEARLDESVRRILGAKAALGLHRVRTVNLDSIATIVGGRAHRKVAAEASQRAITLIKDERGHVPLTASRDAQLLYLSVLDYPSGWGIAAPSRTFIPELRARWPSVTAIELSDRTTPSELELVRATAARYDAIVASVFVRTASYSGRMDLAPPLGRLLRDLARSTAATATPMVAVFFGNPYAATFLPELPAMLLTYDYYDQAEASAVRALAGEAPIGGRLPIALPDLAPLGHGIARAAVRPTTAAAR